MAKKVSSDLINQRLRGGQTSSYPSRIPASRAVEDDDPVMSRGFVAALLVLALVVGGGTYALGGSDLTLEGIMDGTGSRPFVSKADGACKRLWVANAKNTPAITCYMTTNVARLCDPRERKHLAKVMKAYRLDRHAFDSQMVFSGMQAAAIIKRSVSGGNMASMMKAVASASEPGSKGPDASGLAAFDSHMKTLQKMEATISGTSIDASLNMKHIPDGQLVKIIRGLGTSGYMTKGDFGWFSDALVGEAFADLKPKNTPCRN